MSFKGEIETQCAKGCEVFTAEVWSFIRGDHSPDLRLAVKFRECNLLLCPACNAASSPRRLIFILSLRPRYSPLSSRELQAERAPLAGQDGLGFRHHEATLGDGIPLDSEPEIFFGIDELARLLEDEDYRAEEWEVMAHVARGLGLAIYRVSPRYASKTAFRPAAL